MACEPIAEIVGAMLRSAGYKCDAVSDLKTLLRTMKRLPNYDLLFCQVAALEQEKRFLAWVLGQHIPLVTTAVRNWEMVPKPISDRSAAFLRMPFEREQLVELIGKEFAKGENVAATSPTLRSKT
jgi:DNA-binding NtrC family response regulator